MLMNACRVHWQWLNLPTFKVMIISGFMTWLRPVMYSPSVKYYWQLRTLIMHKKYFGTDGIRGREGGEVMTAEFALKLGYAAGRVLGQAKPNKTIVIGKDIGVSGYLFESALEAGLASAGVNIILFCPMPTPAVAWLTRTLHASAGIVISASHNPFFDNGIKFFNQQGEKLSDEQELAIEALLDAPMEMVDSASL